MTESLLTLASARDYFREAVDHAIERQGVTPDDATASYLVELLCEYICCTSDELDQPLTVVMARAESRPHRRIGQLKRVGDHSLYLAGFFRESLSNRQLDLDYYRTLGETAYRRLSALVRKQRSAQRLAHVYRELADEFPQFIEVLGEVKLQGEEPSDVGDLYSAWLQTQSRAIERRLNELGVFELDAEPAGRGEKN